MGGCVLVDIEVLNSNQLKDFVFEWYGYFVRPENANLFAENTGHQAVQKVTTR